MHTVLMTVILDLNRESIITQTSQNIVFNSANRIYIAQIKILCQTCKSFQFHNYVLQYKCLLRSHEAYLDEEYPSPETELSSYNTPKSRYPEPYQRHFPNNVPIKRLYSKRESNITVVDGNTTKKAIGKWTEAPKHSTYQSVGPGLELSREPSFG